MGKARESVNPLGLGEGTRRPSLTRHGVSFSGEERDENEL
jgi:hypothetical protein